MDVSQPSPAFAPHAELNQASNMLGWEIPPSYALAMLRQPSLATAKAIASWDHIHHGCAGALDIPTLITVGSQNSACVAAYIIC